MLGDYKGKKIIISQPNEISKQRHDNCCNYTQYRNIRNGTKETMYTQILEILRNAIVLFFWSKKRNTQNIQVKKQQKKITI